MLRLALFLALLLAPSVRVAVAADGATYAPTPLLKLCPGWTYRVDVTLTNTGTTTWNPGGNRPYELSYHWLSGATVVVQDGLRTPLTASVLPGATITLHADVQAPPTSGTYTLKWDMLHETVGYFSEKGVPTGDLAVTTDKTRACLIGLYVNPMLRALPVITNVAPHVLEPGDVFYVSGTDLGTAGTLRLEGNFPGGSLALTAPVWKDTVVGGNVPDDVTGVPDQAAELVLRRDDGFEDRWPVQFVARRQFRYLDASEVTTAYCSTVAWRNKCNGVGDDVPLGDVFAAHFNQGVLLCPAAPNADGTTAGPVYGGHQCVSLLTDTGDDQYTLDVKNGWALDDVTSHFNRSGDWDFVDWAGSGGHGAIDASWQCDSLGISRPTWYCFYPEIIGPRGVPYK
jgi:hypothetical protein